MAAERKVVPLKPVNVDPPGIPGLPPTVTVGPYEYTFREIDELERNRNGYMGLCSEEDLEIAIALGTAPAHQAETMVHELLHAIWGAGSLADEGPVDEEQIVTVLAKGILQVARDNPEVISWIAAAYGLAKP
jgi:hypothetical protein